LWEECNGQFGQEVWESFWLRGQNKTIAEATPKANSNFLCKYLYMYMYLRDFT